MPIQAVNQFVFIIRDDITEEVSGLVIPGQGQEKPNYGLIHSAGELIADKKIESGKRAMFHKGGGMSIEFEGVEYVVIEGDRIISIID